MRSGNTRQRKVLVVRQRSKEMNTPQIDVGADLVQKCLLPCPSVRWSRAVGHTCAADDTYLRVRPGFENCGKSPHEDVKAPIRFQVSGNKRKHFVTGFQHRWKFLVTKRHVLRTQRIGINAVVNDTDFLMKLLRKLRTLPLGWRDRGIGIGKTK